MNTEQGKQWTEGDVDASYFLGFMAAYAILKDSSPDTDLMNALTIELRRLDKMGFKGPNEAVKLLRYPCKPTTNE